jgi:DNA-binding transcriptional LysR family regulator
VGTLDLNHVSTFVRVVEDGSFTAAARALGAPKSSVSRSVAQLERDLGVKLLHRTTRKLHLTDAGMAFHQRVSRALAEIQEATTRTSDLQRELRGDIRVTAPIDLGVWAIAGIVARFVRRHPDVHVEVRLSSRVVDLVAEGFDLAVRAGPLRDPSLVARRVGDLELGLYVSSKYLARRGQPASVADLSAHDVVVLRSENGTLAWHLTSTSGEEKHVDPTGAIAADDMSFVKKAVLAGGGIALMPTFYCAREIISGKLVRVLPDWRFNSSMLNVVYPSGRYVPHRVIVLRDYLVKELGKISRACPRAKAGETQSPP